MEAPAEKGGKTSVRANLQRLVNLGRKDLLKQLEGPDFPIELGYLWEWFLEIRSAPRMTMEGAAALSWSDIDTWARLTDREVSPQEVNGLIALDYAFRNPPKEEEEE
jgi:hypothetical protein